jgi:hypothetical protein
MLIKMMDNRAMQKIARFLPRYLAITWGKRDDYTIAQVDRALEETGCNSKFSEFAYVMFCSEETFSTVSSKSYSSLKAEVADNFFSGDNSVDSFSADSSGSSNVSSTVDSGGSD